MCLLSCNFRVGSAARAGVLAVACLFSACFGLQASPIAYVYSASNQFGTIDLSSGIFTLIGNTGVSLTSLTITGGGTLYSQNGSNNLVTVNPATGLTTPIGPGSSAAISARSDGALYGVDLSVLYSVSPTTGATTSVGPFGTNFVGDAATFNSSNQLFLVGATSLTTTGLYTVNTSTGAATLIGNDGFLVLSIFFSGNTLYGFTADPTTFAPGPIVTLNTSNGLGTPVGVQDPSLAIVFGSALFPGTTSTTPEPATFALAGIATACLLIARKRRA